jgi:GNAT superfamily N-acetyltransferase
MIDRDPLQRPRGALSKSIEFRESNSVPKQAVLDLYHANNWSSANKPEQLHQALLNSHSLVTAWDGEKLVGLANSISDGFLVVYYPHIVVHPDYQRQGIGRELMARLMRRYAGFHQQAVLADQSAVAFYESCGFEQSACLGMWIYDGNEHAPDAIADSP